MKKILIQHITGSWMNIFVPIQSMIETLKGIFNLRSAEENLLIAAKADQEERNKIISKDISDIEKLLESQDATPTRTHVITRNRKRLEDIARFAHDGKKLSLGIESYDSPHDYPFEMVLRNLQWLVEFVLQDLNSKTILPKEIEKGGYWSGRTKGVWTEKEIRNLPFDWAVSAIICFYQAAEKKNTSSSCSNEKGVITSKELVECVKIVRLGSVDAYLASID